MNQSAIELHGRRLYTNSCFSTGIIEGVFNTRIEEHLFLNTQKRVLINGEIGNNVYFMDLTF